MIRQLKNSLFVLALLFTSTVATAHPLAPALLELEQQSATNWTVLWRRSAIQASRNAPEPILPDNCTSFSKPVVTAEANRALSSRLTMRCETESLLGQRIGVNNLQQNPINVILRVTDLQGGQVETLLDDSRPEFVIPAPERQSSVMIRYLELGIEHLVLGPDHLLFLLALLLLVRRKKSAFWALTAFTLGHSVTLSLAALDMIAVNAAFMELCIALTLVIAALELLRSEKSWLGRHPAGMAFSFGLIHGLGFAAALSDIGLPTNAIVPALLAFNIGIEIGQIGVAIAVFLLAVLLQRAGAPIRQKVVLASAAYLIGSLAVFWCIERIGMLNIAIPSFA